jgi:hypothetical protein
MRTETMPDTTLPLPDDVRAKLEERARRNGQTLERYLIDQLTEWTSRPTMDEWLESVDDHIALSKQERGEHPPPDVDVVELIRTMRAERDAHIAGL